MTGPHPLRSSTRHLFPVRESPTCSHRGVYQYSKYSNGGSGTCQSPWSPHSPCARRLLDQIGHRMTALEIQGLVASSHRSFPESRLERQQTGRASHPQLTRPRPLHPWRTADMKIRVLPCLRLSLPGRSETGKLPGTDRPIASRRNPLTGPRFYGAPSKRRCTVPSRGTQDPANTT